MLGWPVSWKTGEKVVIPLAWAMDIRTAQPEDYETIAAIWYESASQMDGGAPILDHPNTLVERIISSLANGWSLKVAVVDRKIVGLLATIPKDNVLDQLFVTPEAQRQGIGAALLDEAKRQLPMGFMLRTPATNLAAHRFYEQHGLFAIEDAAHPVTGTPVRHFGWQQ
ncbi:N-acetyltransferase [Sphingobium sp. TomTYG75]